ncbi:hypothetical protein [Polyangium aurulentum]|uniref:hypothetical protein n=1 Tax=Polyangium aurulentum TaxID=2567896 RepID=UPI0010ADAF00|nr:hypothetical protein [Polyangium aurulentum]UQA61997.1 hypothetical protein E8A73_016590 [Polyangium aurulentum]
MRPRGERALVAFAFGVVVAALAYAALRVLEAALFPEADPAIVIWSDRSRFVWRALIATYLGGMGAFGGYALGGRSARAAASLLPPVVLVGATLLALQGALWP